MITIKFLCSLPNLNIFPVRMDQTAQLITCNFVKLALITYNFIKFFEQFLKTNFNYYGS